MAQNFSFSTFLSRFPDEDSCLEEIRLIRYHHGIECVQCNKKTKHYKIRGRNAYACKVCRKQLYPLAGTIFEKTTTPLRLWFYAMYLMSYTRADISVRDLQRELGVTYKTAWRMFQSIRTLMEQNDGDLLTTPGENRLLNWTFFNRFELKVVEKQESTEG